MAGAANHFAAALGAAAPQLSGQQKSVILLWMDGGPATIDIWDLKPGAPTGGPFKPISTSGDGQISEHMPLMAKHMHQMAIVRSMSTTEADHGRGRSYMHTGFVPSPNLDYPGYGSVVSKEMMESGGRDIQLPPFIAIGGGSVGPGFLGMTYAPFVVSSNGNINNLRRSWGPEGDKVARRMAMLDVVEQQFVSENRGRAALDHQQVLRKTWDLMTSQQLAAFELNRESPEVRERYGNTGFGNGCLLARRLVEAGVPFIEVDLGGWDTHQNNFAALQNKLPELDRGMSALVEDLVQRGMFDSTAIVWMGEFGRTPRINEGNGRDHWARSWSVVVGGAGFQRGVVIGETSADGTEVVSKPYKSQDLMASVISAVGISLDKVYKTPTGRPIKIANGGQLIEGLLT
jgi:hypothetical protein